MIKINQQDKVYIVCDVCQSHSRPGDTPNHALDLARYEGFYVFITPSTNLHTCSGRCYVTLSYRLRNQKAVYQIMPPTFQSDDEPNTYTQEFDEFTDAHPGL